MKVNKGFVDEQTGRQTDICDCGVATPQLCCIISVFNMKYQGSLMDKHF